jgi:hypothetical protein
LIDYLNDVVVAGTDLPLVSRKLDGKTLVINNGSDHTVTFSGYELSPKDIIDQINAVVSGAAGLRTPGYGVVGAFLCFNTVGHLVRHTGTANSILRLDTANDQTVGANAIAQANIISITYDGSGKFTVVHV